MGRGVRGDDWQDERHPREDWKYPVQQEQPLQSLLKKKGQRGSWGKLAVPVGIDDMPAGLTNYFSACLGTCACCPSTLPWVFFPTAVAERFYSVTGVSTTAVS